MLAGLGTIGIASAGAGLGTTALFTDEESFTGNSVQAGDMNLEVRTDNILHSTDIVRDNTTIEPKDTADGNEVTITIEDLKPGDWLILAWEAQIIGNPGHIQVTSVDEDYANDEGMNPEPEGDTASPGDLGDALLTSIWRSYQPSTGSRNDLEHLDETTDLNDTGLASWEQPNLDGVTASGAHYTTMNEAHGVYSTGVILRDPATGDPLVVGARSADEDVDYYQLFELPPGVGNDVQGDSVTFTLRWEAEQARNNDDPFNGA